MSTSQVLEAGWLLTYDPAGTNTLTTARSLGVNYENAWTLLHKYRQVMYEAMQQVFLKGVIEIDETYIGGIQSGIRGRGALGKYCILVMIERRKRGRARCAIIESAARRWIYPEIQAAISGTGTLHTDANTAYDTLREQGYRHKRFNISAGSTPAHVHLPVIHSFASNLDAWLEGQIKRTSDEKHLPYYLAEYAYRFNHRGVKNRGLIFYRLIEKALQHKTVTQEDIDQR